MDHKTDNRLLATLFLLLIAHLQVQSQATETEGYVVNDSTRVWFRVEGGVHTDAIPILLLHGGPGATARPFEKTIGPLLGKTHKVIYMDYRGAGRSDRPNDPAKYSLAVLASDIEVPNAFDGHQIPPRCSRCRNIPADKQVFR